MESIVNSLISSYLAEYLVINPEKTKLSILEGTVELQGVKFKKTLFATLNLPYLELVDGYIGKIFIQLSLPRFYLYPINVLVDKIYVKVKPKNTNKMKEEEILATFDIYKKKRLLQLEKLMNIKLASIFENKNDNNKTETKKEKLTMLENIINNLHVKIQNIVTIYEDCISNENYPITLGVTLNRIFIDSTSKNFNYNQLSEEEKLSPLKYKKLTIENLNIFLDSINPEDIIKKNGEIIKTKLKIREETRKKLDEKEKIYLFDSIDFYLYCESEIQYYSKDSNYHNYLLRDLNPEIRLVINENFHKENNAEPEMKGTIDIKTISVEVSNMQVKALTDTINYISLQNFYQKTIIDNHFIKVEKIDNNLIRNYLDEYSQYYKTKYIEIYKNDKENKKFLANMEVIEKNLRLESIQTIREMGNDIINSMIEIGKIDKEIKDADGGFWSFFRSKNNEEIEKLKLEREKKIKEQEELKLKNDTLNQFKDYFVEKMKNDENDKTKEDKIEFVFIFLMEKLNLVIKEQNKDEKMKKIFEINFIKFESQLMLKAISQSIKLNLYDMQFSQFLSDNKDYEKILYSKNFDIDKKEENTKSLISIEFEHNIKFPISPFKIKLHFGKQLFIIIDYYYLYYLYNLFLKHINALDFDNISSSINETITSIVKSGYENLVKSRGMEEGKEENNKKLMNIHVDISLTTPILLFPLNFRDENNKQMLYISLGILKIKSQLADTTNEQEIYDKYIIELSNFIMKTINIYNTDEMIKDDVGDKIIYKSSFNIELQNYIYEIQKKSHKTKDFSPLIVNINLKNIKLGLCEEQIIFLINYLEYFLRAKNEFEREEQLLKKENANEKEKNESLNQAQMPLSKETNNNKSELLSESQKKKENIVDSSKEKQEIKNINKDEISNILKLNIKFGIVQLFLIRNLNETKKINFLSFFFKESFLYLLMQSNNSIDMDISFGHFYLYDKDLKINETTKKEVEAINPEFKYIMGTTLFDFKSPKGNKIKFSEIYNYEHDKSPNQETLGNESIKMKLNLDAITNQIDINITMCKLTLSPNFSTLSRALKFIFKYLEIYNQSIINLKFEKLREQIKDKNEKKFKGASPAPPPLDKNNYNILDIEKDSIFKTREKSTLNIMFTMEGINVLLPIDYDSKNTYIIFMSLEMPMNYIMKTDAELSIKDSQLIKQHFFMKKSQLSIYIKEGSFSIYEFKDDFILLNNKKKLINDFEMSFFLNSSLDNKEKTNNNYIKISFDRDTEISININHVIIFLGLFEKLNEFLVSLNPDEKQKKIPNKTEEIINDDDLKRAINNSIINERERIEENEKLKRKESKLKNEIQYTDIFSYEIIFSDFYIKFYDIIDGVYQSLFEFSMKDTKTEFLQNNNPKDSTNLIQYIKSTFSNDEKDKKKLDSYDKKNIFLFFKILTNVEIKSLNNYLNQWEYLVEPFKLEFYFCQLLKRMRPNIELFVNNMININVSLNFAKILQFAIKKFTLKQAEIKKEKEETLYDGDTITDNIDTPRYLGYESPLLVIENNTGVDMEIWFDNIKYENANKESIITIKKDEKCELTINLLKKLNVGKKRNNNNFNSTMSYKFCLDKNLIKELNIKEKNLIGNNFNINYHQMSIHNISSQVKMSVESCSDNLLIRHIIFSSLISLKNETPYQNIGISNNIEEINLSMKKKQNIPVSWLLEKLNPNLCLIHDNDMKILMKNMSDINNMNKVVKFKNGNVIMVDIIKYKLNLDEYYLNKNISQKKEDIYRIDIIISSPINLLNSTPYEFAINGNEKISSMKSLSSNANDPNLLLEYSQKVNNPERKFKLNCEIIMRIISDIKLQIFYQNKNILANTYIYEDEVDEGKSSNNFSIYNNSISILMRNKGSKEFLICRLILNNPYNALLFDNKSYKEMKVELNSFRYEIIFDYYFINETLNNLYFNSKSIDEVSASKENILIPSKQLLPISKILLHKKIKLRKTEKDWTNNFEYTALGKEFILNAKNEKKTYNALSLIANVSMIYKKSITFTIEEKFMVINELPFNINIKEEKSGIVVKYKSKESNILLLDKQTLDEKCSFRVGIDNCFSHMFDPSKLGSYDLLIPYDQKTFVTYNIDIQNKLIEYDSKFYFPIRCIINTIQKNTIYILFSLNHYYINQLTNCTPQSIQVFVEGHKNKRYIVKPEKTIPLVYINNDDKYKPLETISIVFNGKNKTRVNINDVATKLCDKNKDYYIRIRPEKNNSIKSITLFGKKDERILEDFSMKKKIKKYISSQGAKILLNLEGIGLSIIDETPKEIFYFSLYKIFLIYSFSSYKNILNEIKLYDSFTFSIKNLELDYCLDNAYDIIFNPTNQILPPKYGEKIKKEKNFLDKVKEVGDEDTPFIQILISKKTIQEKVNNRINVLYAIYPQFAVFIQEFDVRINTILINCLINLINQYTQIFLPSNENVNENDKNVINKEKNNLIEDNNLSINEISDKLMKKGEDRNMNQLIINYLTLSAIRVNATFKINKNAIEIKFIPELILTILNTLCSSLTSFSDVTIKLSELTFVNVFNDYDSLFEKFTSFYKNELLAQIYKIIFNMDLIGNPVNLVEGLGTGIFEFFNEPRKGLLKGPEEFGLGIAKGTRSLVSNIVGGGFKSASKITGSLLTASKNLSSLGTEEEVIVKEEEKPRGLFSGTLSGIKKGFREIKSGVSGIVTKPIEQTKKGGFGGFFKGLGSGLLGAVLTPVNTVLTVGNEVTSGISNSEFISNKKVLRRFRPPRTLYKYVPIKPYNEKEEIERRNKRKEIEGTDKIVISLSNESLCLENSTQLISCPVLKDNNVLLFTDVMIKILDNEYKKLIKKIYVCNIQRVDEKDNKVILNLKNNEQELFLFSNQKDKNSFINEISKLLN